MRAVAATGRDVPEVLDVELHAPGAHEVRARIDASAMCATELHTLSGQAVMRYQPMILGHSAVGEVLEVGPEVGRVKAGDKVAISGSMQCGTCRACLRGSPGACEQIFVQMGRQVGVDTEGRAVYGDGGAGVHAQEAILPEWGLVPIESDAPAEHLAMLGCGICSGLGSVLEVARVQQGDNVAVFGAGHLGLWMAQGARVAGAERIIVVEPRAERRAVAGQIGATDVLDLTDDVVAQVRDLTGGLGVDVALEAAGTAEAVQQAFATTRWGGTVVPTGMPGDRTAGVTVSQFELAIGSKRVQGTQTGSGDLLRMVPKYVQYLNDGLIDARPILSGTYTFDQVDDAVRGARERTNFTGVLLPR
jgi:Zn-dependent alcohol dehydrogenase